MSRIPQITATSRDPTAPRRKRILAASTALGGLSRVAWGTIAATLFLPAAASAQALPTGGVVSAGAASVSGHAGTLTVTQTSQNAAINWQSFSIGRDNAVVFVQPNSSSVALNRVLGPDPSAILGSLTANGKVFLVNPNGILFGKGAQVNVGGLVASTLGIADADFMAGRYAFSGGGGTVLNEGTINADGGYVALLGASVGNDGVIQARLGTIALAAGDAVTLDVAGDGLLNVTVDTGAVNALVSNGGLLRADGGQVVMTAQAAGGLLKTVVNNSGVVEARTLENRGGRITLLGDMASGTANVGGVLDASAPDGGNGGFIETSAATVNIASDARITTAAAAGTTGTWLIDPQDFTIGGANGNISGATLSAMLVTNSVSISTLPGPNATVPGTPPVTSLGTTTPGNGDINVNEAVAWTAAPSTTTLTLTAVRDVNVNAAITATNGNVVLCCGRDANINAAVTTTNGSMLFSAGRDVNLHGAGFNQVNPAIVGTLTATDGNITLCAGADVLIAGAMTLTRGNTIPAQSLGLTSGLVLIAGNDGTGPGVAGGTVTFAPLTPPAAITNAAVTINYNPVSYAAPTDYSIDFTLTEGAALTQHMLLFPTATKVADGTTGVVLTGFKSNAASGLPTGVTLVAGPGSSAAFDDPNPGSNIGITYAGYSLAGAGASKYALAVPCCGAPTRSSGTITPAPVVVPPVVTPPVVTPPVVTPPVVTPPVVTPPVETPPVVPPVVVPPVVTPPVVVPPVETPPVVVPPVVTPPVVTPPVVVPPVETPPVVVPPVVTPPVVTPPVVVPPVETPPVVVPPVETPPVVVPPVVTPPVITPPVVVPPVETPPVVVPPVVTPPVVVPPVETPPVVVPPVVTPPVVTPPVVVPPVETPPVVVPPVVTPPVVTPPVVVPPVETPPVVVPPVVTPPVVTPPVVVAPVVTPPVVTPPVVVTPITPPLAAANPASAIAAAIAALNASPVEEVVSIPLVQDTNLSIVSNGVAMPADRLGESQFAGLDRTAVTPAPRPLVVAAQPRRPVYPRKQDRN